MQFLSLQDPWLALYGFIFRIDRCIKRPRYKMVSSDVRIHGAVAWQGGEFQKDYVQPPKQKKYDLLHGCKGRAANNGQHVAGHDDRPNIF